MSRCQLLSFSFIFIPSIVFLNTIGWTMILLFMQVKSASIPESQISTIMPSVAKFFPQINSDLSRVKWGHGINSKNQLSRSIYGNDMMIEADVSLGTVSGRDGQILPIMAHPPFKTSDLSLEEFLDTVLSSNKQKGIKLDFKDMEVVETSLQIIKTRSNKIYTIPLWLNADIIHGPVNATAKPLDAIRFLNLTKSYFPGAVLSVGWTTRYGPDVTSSPLQIINEGSYTMSHMIQLRDALVEAQIRQPITFPIRAGLSTIPESQQSILWLLEQIEDSTLTIWSSQYDTVDVPGLMKLVKHVDPKKMYMDVPSGLLCEIQHFNEYY